jgi:hypothetical protein
MAVVPTKPILIRFEVLTAVDVKITVCFATVQCVFAVMTQFIKKPSDTTCKFNQ